MEPEIVDLCDSEDENPPPPPSNNFAGENVIAECSLCTCCFNTTTAFIDHMTSYHRLGRLHECNLCHQFFMSEGGLTHHMDTAHSVSVGHRVSTDYPVRQIGTSSARTAARFLACDICGDKFSFQEALEQHKFVHVVEKKYSVVADFENETPPDKRYTCSICFKKFFVEKAMLMHKKRKHILLKINRSQCNIFKCKTCDRSFPKRKNLLIHESWHGRTQRQKRQVGAVGFTGNVCSTSLLTLRNFRKALHRKNELPIGESSAVHLRTLKHKSVKKVVVKRKQYPCVLCDREFLTKRGIMVHDRWHAKMSAASQDVSYSIPANNSCEPAVQRLNKSNSAVLLPKIVDREEDGIIEGAEDSRISDSESYKCKFCYKEFAHVFPYEQHMEKSHSTKKNLICQVCGECFEFESSLEYHEMYRHSSKSLMFCSLCTRPFTNKIYLNDHFKICYQERKAKSLRNVKEVQHLQSEEISSNGIQSYTSSSNQTTPNKVTSTITPQLPLVNQMNPKEVTSTISSSKRRTTPKKTPSSRVASLRPTSVNFSVLPERVPRLLNRLYFSCNICFKDYLREDRLIQHVLLVHSSEEFPFSCDVRKPSPPLPLLPSQQIQFLKSPLPPQCVPSQSDSSEKFSFSCDVRKPSPPLPLSPSQHAQFSKSPSPQCVPSQNQILPDHETLEPVVDFSLSHSVASSSSIQNPTVSENPQTQSIDSRLDTYQMNLWEP